MDSAHFGKYLSFTSKDFVSDDSFVKYVSCPNQEDLQFWSEFLQCFPEKRREVQDAHLLVKALQPAGKKMPLRDLEEIWQNLSKDHSIKFGNEKNLHQSSRKSYKTHFLVSCVVLLIVVVFALFPEREEEIYTYKTGFDQVGTVILPDQSRIKLNANSSIRVWASGRLRKKSQVELRGEAHFTVKKKKQWDSYQTMWVHTQSGTVEVTGTVFNVYSRGNKTKVYLREGGVKIKKIPDFPVIVMHPGDLIQFDKKEKTIFKKKMAPEVVDAWIHNKVVFNKTPLTEVFQHIKDIHGLDFQLEEKVLLEKSFTGVLPANDLNLLIKSLEEVFDVIILRKKDMLLISLK
jgi:ferric-dicitrate binding protein FerR (iron transport regulator)